MKTKHFFCTALICSLAFFTFGAAAKADILYGDPNGTNNYVHYFKFLNDANNNGWHYADSIQAVNDTTNQQLRMFCVDYFTQTSAQFADPASGQAYNAVSLNSPSMTLYSDLQKSVLNSLFSHVYGTVFDANGGVIDSFAVYGYQLAVWEIIHETSGVFAINSGSFGISSAATYPNPNVLSGALVDTTFYNQITALTNSWLSAATGATAWDAKYATATDYDLTVYVAEGGTNISQTFLSTKGPATTPEPASMLIFGLGIAVLPIARRFRRTAK